MYIFSRPCTILAVLLMAATTTAPASDWTRWGGPNGNFKVDSKPLADSWPEDGPKQLWRRDLGSGYSAILVKDDVLYTMYRKDDQTDAIVALSAKDGKTRWETTYKAPTDEKHLLRFGRGPNSTSLIEGDHLISLGYTGILTAVDLKGSLKWKVDLIKDHGGKIQKFGISASPIMYKGNVIVLVGGKQGVMAFNPKDGSVAWKSEPLDVSLATPIVIDVDGQDQIVFFGDEEVYGIDGKGKLQWRHPVVNQYKNNATDPIYVNGLLWAATQLDGGTRALRLKRESDKTVVEEAWNNPKVKLHYWTAMPIDDHIYVSIGSNSTNLVGVEIATGEISFRHRGLPEAKFIAADGKLVYLDNAGKLGMVRVNPRGVEELASFQLFDDSDPSRTIPTLVGNTLYARDRKEIVALNLGE